MIKEFVPYDIALAMKELGFDGVCLARYKGDILTLNSFHCNSDFKIHNRFHEHKITAPLYQQAFRWFRRELQDKNIEPYSMVAHIKTNRGCSFEEAQDETLKRLIEIVKEKK